MPSSTRRRRRRSKPWRPSRGCSRATRSGTPLTADQVAWRADPREPVYVTDPESDAQLPDWARRGTQLAGVKASIFLPMRAGQLFVGFVGLYGRRPRLLRPEQLR